MDREISLAKNIMDNLSQNIISTITYYDVLNYPMTSFEIWKYLINSQESAGMSQKNKKEENFNLADILKELEKENIRRDIEEYRGFYFLKGKANLVDQRIERNKVSDRKIKKARKIVFWLRFIPFIKMVLVAGRVGAKNAQGGSDIDVLIIFKHGKIFTGRFLSTILIHILGQRRHKNKIANRICLNHFLTDKFNIYIQDLYSSHNYVFSTPIYNGIFFNELLAKNQWIKKYRPNLCFSEKNIKEIKDDFFSLWVRKSLEFIFNSAWIERILKKWQIKKIENNPLTQKKGGMIIYSDFELSFWPDFENQGPRIFEKFKQRKTT